MKHLRPDHAARAALAANAERPATGMLLDSPDVRLVVFRIAPGQVVPPHRSPSTVLLSVISGAGAVLGRDGWTECSTGDVFVFEPAEVHAMRSTDGELLLLATLAPRPGARPS